MSNSVVMHLSRSGKATVVDREDIPHTDDPHPIMTLAVAVLNAGYTGIALDELKLSNGRVAHALDVNLSTPEGRVFQALSFIAEAGGSMPEAPTVLAGLQVAYQTQTKAGRAA